MPNKKSKTIHQKPYQVYNLKGKSRMIILCDHASSYIPSKYMNLGLGKKEIRRHIGWDIGAALVAKKIAKRLNATLIMSGFSRLLVDCNRPLGVPQAFTEISESTIIPANLNLTKKNKKYRAKKYCIPYRDRIDKILRSRIRKKIIPVIIAVHSFTPVYKGFVRPWHLGLLYRKDRRMVSLVQDQMINNKSIKIGINEPYKCNLKGDYSIPYFGESNGLPNILFEIRQDLINNKAGVIKWSHKLSNLLEKIIFHPTIKSSITAYKDVLIYYKKKNKI